MVGIRVFPFGAWPIFKGHVSFRECTLLENQDGTSENGPGPQRKCIFQPSIFKGLFVTLFCFLGKVAIENFSVFQLVSRRFLNWRVTNFKDVESDV